MDLLDDIIDFLDELIAIDFDTAWFKAVDEEVQDLVIRLNTEEQLGKGGIDADGNSLGDYAPFTVNVRSDLGLQTDHIDFKVTGDYWRSFDVLVDKNGYTVVSDTERFEELVNELGFTSRHLGLTKENEQKVFKLIREKYLDYVDAL